MNIKPKIFFGSMVWRSQKVVYVLVLRKPFPSRSNLAEASGLSKLRSTPVVVVKGAGLDWLTLLPRFATMQVQFWV